MFSGQGNGAGGAAFNANLAARQAAKWMCYKRLPGFVVPFKNVVRAEVEALKVGQAHVRVNPREPGEVLAKVVEEMHG